MAGNLEQIVLEILLKDRASEGLGRTSGAARLAGDSVGALNKKLDEVSRKTAEARVRLAGDKDAQASLDKLDTKLLGLDRRTANPRITVEGAARALAEISAVDAELDKLGGKGGEAEKATSALSALAGSGGIPGGGMGALIGAGVALSPVIATLGVGLAGFGLAAAGIAKPIADAAGKTGGLAKNMHLLDPEQRAVAKGVLDLGKQYDQFQKVLKPEVLGAFGEGLGIAGHLLHDIQPVAVATGKAFNVMLSRIDAEFQSGEWQQFFGFMAKNAGPDMALLGNLFIDLAKDIPPLLTQLQPLAEGFLKDADAVLKLVNATTQAVAWEHQHADAISHSTGWLGRFRDAAVKAFGQMFPGARAAGALKGALDKAGTSTDSTSGKIRTLGGAAKDAAVKVQSVADAVARLTDKENKALTPLLTYTNAVLTQRDDAKKLNDALKTSHDRIGLNTDAQRASFSAAQTYIQDLLNTASAAHGAHKNIDDQIRSIQNALPALRNVKGGTKDYWQEVQTLVGWLRQLQQIKLISEKVHITGSGQWAFVQGGGQNMRLHAASGMLVPGGYGGGDRVPILAEPGEAVVPKHLTPALAPFLRAHGVPGFTAGGIVPSYSGALKGLQPWGQHNWQATVTGITTGIAKAMLAAAPAGGARGAGPGNLPLGLGPHSGSAAVAQAFARSILWAYGWGPGQFPPLQALWNQESGWNAYAVNPSSGAYGIPQSLGHGHPYNLGDYQAQIRWGLGYISGRYGSPANAWAHERAFNWYGSGLDAIVSTPTLIGVGERGPERVTVTPAGRGGSTYIINITLPPGSDREQGRRIVGYIKSFEKGSGAGWRK